MQDQWSFRPGSLEDIEALVAIERQTYPEPWTEQHFKSELEKPYSQLLLLTDDETDSKVAGYAVFWFMFDECDLHNLVVSLPYRGLGFGKKMLQQVIHQASKKGVKKVRLEVRKSNEAAISLYQYCQFSIHHVRKKFYSNQEDAYTMVLPLEVKGEKSEREESEK